MIRYFGYHPCVLRNSRREIVLRGQRDKGGRGPGTRVPERIQQACSFSAPPPQHSRPLSETLPTVAADDIALMEVRLVAFGRLSSLPAMPSLLPAWNAVASPFLEAWKKKPSPAIADLVTGIKQRREMVKDGLTR